jgi:hypothetical protein
MTFDNSNDKNIRGLFVVETENFLTDGGIA